MWLMPKGKGSSMTEDVIVTISLPRVSLEWLWEHLATLYGQLMIAGVRMHIAVDRAVEEDELLSPWRMAVAEATRAPVAIDLQPVAPMSSGVELGIEVRLRLAEGGWFWRIPLQQIAPAWQGPYEAAPEARAAAVDRILTLAAQGAAWSRGNAPAAPHE